MESIRFLLDRSLIDIAPPPLRAANDLPRWWRELPGEPAELAPDEFPNGTAKRCMPILDAMSAGYLIRLPAALRVNAVDEDNVHFSWRPGTPWKMVDGHSPQQIGDAGPKNAFKWSNPWRIETPPGVSCLFVTPINRPKLPFELFTGVVDTDSYHALINFPFYWTEFPYDQILEEGEPICQVIPFRREEWEAEISEMSEEEHADTQTLGQKVSAHLRHYRREHHHKKTYG